MFTDMKHRFLVFATSLFLIPAICASQTASDDLFEQYASDFFASLGSVSFSQTTNTPPWTPPTNILIDGVTWSLQSNQSTEEPFDISFSLVATNNMKGGEFHVCNVSDQSAVPSVLASIINIPCNLPPSMVASAFSVSATTSGVFFLRGPRLGSHGTNLYAVCQNLILVMPNAENIEDSFATAIIRAGGLNIPNSPPPSPNP